MILYQSNCLKTLSSHLCSLLRVDPPPPFEAETIVVQHYGMAQWLHQNIATENKIAAHVHFPLPARFFGEISHCFLRQDQGGSIPDQEKMMWQIFSVLPEFTTQNQHQEITHYLSGQDKETKQYQLARTTASLFDKYTIYRPDVLINWIEGKDHHWQAELWRFLDKKYLYGTPTFYHFLKILRQNPDPIDKLPRRCIFFGINSMVPIYLDLLDHLDHYMELHLFHLSPCREYWGDISSEKEQARARKSTQENIPYAFTGNSLLSSWGALGRDFMEQLMAYDVEQFDQYTPALLSSNLGTIQNDILNLSQQESNLPFAGDQSLQFHSCHSPLREIQVLHDNLLQIIETNPEITAGDILVTAPDISVYGGSIQGVFESSPEEQRIPYHLADRPLSSDRLAVKGFLDLLHILTGRITAPDVYALLENSSLALRFGIKEQDLPRLRQLIGETATRWGLDGDHLESLGFKAAKENTWEYGLDQLLLGHIMGEVDQSFMGIFPYHTTDSGDETLLGGMCSFFASLKYWQQVLTQVNECARWPQLFLELLHAFFNQEEDEAGFQILTEILLDWQEQTLTAVISSTLSPSTALQHIANQLTQQHQQQPFLTGKVTFCNMVPMRAVPFKVVCVLGMDDGAFPRDQQPVSFDLTLKSPRIGDRDRRSDDRFLFLEMLLSAEKILYLSWTGQSQHDDSPIPPSIVISELLELVDKKYPSTSDTPSKQVVINHPLQPFSESYFSPDSPFWSYAEHFLPSPRRQSEASFISGPLATETEHAIALGDLVSFWCHPCRYYLEQKIGIRFNEFRSSIDDHEPFSLDALDQFYLRQNLVETALSDHENTSINKLAQSGIIPRGWFGSITLDALLLESKELAERIKAVCTKKLEPIEVNLQFGEYLITGALHHLCPMGRVRWRGSKLKGVHLMELWIYHLVLSLLVPENMMTRSLYLAKDKQATLGVVDNPEQYFGELLKLYELGQQKPLHFFPESAYSYATAKPDKKDGKALATWLGSSYQKGPKAEFDDPVYHKLFDDDPAQAINDDFIALSQVFVPLLQHLEIEDEAS